MHGRALSGFAALRTAGAEPPELARQIRSKHARRSLANRRSEKKTPGVGEGFEPKREKRVADA
jgi:hypothetical protein